jgi:hypothetical protein
VSGFFYLLGLIKQLDELIDIETKNQEELEAEKIRLQDG